MVGEAAPDDSPRADHDVLPEHGPGQDDHTRPQPTAVTDQDRNVAGPLGMDNLVRVLVPVVLVRDVHVGPGVDVVPDLQLEVADDVATATDHAPVADPHHRIGDHLLSWHHAGGDAHMGSDQCVATQSDPLFAEERSWRKGETGTGSERAEPGCHTVAGSDGAVPGRPAPSGVDQRAEPAPPDGTFGGGETRVPRTRG